MPKQHSLKLALSALAAATMLVACGGGGDAASDDTAGGGSNNNSSNNIERPKMADGEFTLTAGGQNWHMKINKTAKTFEAKRLEIPGAKSKAAEITATTAKGTVEITTDGKLEAYKFEGGFGEMKVNTETRTVVQGNIKPEGVAEALTIVSGSGVQNLTDVSKLAGKYNMIGLPIPHDEPNDIDVAIGQIFIAQDGKVTICDQSLVDDSGKCYLPEIIGDEKIYQLNLKLETVNVGGITQILAKKEDGTVFGAFNNIPTEFGNGNTFNISFGLNYVYAVNQTQLQQGFIDGSWHNSKGEGATFQGNRVLVNGQPNEEELFYNKIPLDGRNSGKFLEINGFIGSKYRYGEDVYLPIFSTLMAMENEIDNGGARFEMAYKNNPQRKTSLGLVFYSVFQGRTHARPLGMCKWGRSHTTIFFVGLYRLLP